LALAVAASAPGGEAVAKDAPLFSALQAFCVQTGAKPAAVGAAVEAAGGVLETPATSTSFPIPMSITIWKASYAGRPIRVTSGVTRASGRPPLASESCTVEDFSRDKSSVAAIANWLGVKPPVFRHETTTDFFLFEYAGGQPRVASSDEATFARDRAEGRVWQLTLTQSVSGESAQLMHFPAVAEGR
jgi:hypothetical protein